MPDYLTTAANFKCKASPAVSFRIIENGNRHVTYNGNLVLTDEVKLLGTGNCLPLTTQAGGTPVPCCCNIGRWIATDPKTIIGRHSLLTKSSQAICQSSPTPVPISAMQSGVNGNFVKALAMSIAVPTVETPKPRKNLAIENSAIKNSPPIENPNAIEKNPATIQNQSASETSDLKSAFRCEYCQKNCEFRMNGEPSTHAKSPVPKDAQKMARRYEAYLKNGKFNDADKYYISSLNRQREIIAERRYEPWTYAAHHIIPYKVFSEFPNTSYVANLCIDPNDESTRVFDINDAANCIQLPTRSSTAKYDTLLDSARKYVKKLRQKLPDAVRSLIPIEEIASFERMLAVEAELDFEMQWHDSHHTYKFHAEELKEFASAINEKFPGKELLCYTDAVKRKLDIIEGGIELNDICAAQVRYRLLRLIDNIRQHLADFAKSPQSSYPYFVTKNNIFYALQEAAQ